MNGSFLRRLKYYGIGFGIGCIFVFFFFRNRGCSWTPGNRVKNSILSRVITSGELEWEFIQSKGFTKEDILKVLDDGDVDFGESKKDGSTKVYAIDREFEGKGMQRFYFTLPNESYLSEVKIGEVKASDVKNTTKGRGRLLYFPKDENLVFPDSTAMVTCQQEKLGLINPKDILKKLKKNGYVDFSKTNFKAKPKAEHFLCFVLGKDTIGTSSVWYQNKIFISNFVFPDAKACDSIPQRFQ